MPDPADALSRLVAADSTRPMLTYYDDAPGPSKGERIELSRGVLANWVAKAANALQEGLDAEPGTVLMVDLPQPHWRTVYWALAIWGVGGTLTLDPHEGADILVTDNLGSDLVDDADEVIAVTLPALARSFPTDLRSGVMDEAADLSTYGDTFTPWSAPEPGDAALVHDGQRITYADLLPDPSWPSGSRVLVADTDAAGLLQHLLHALAAGASLVLVRGSDGDIGQDRMRAEGVDLVATAP